MQSRRLRIHSSRRSVGSVKSHRSSNRFLDGFRRRNLLNARLFQIMGEGSGRVITLSHSAQMKRFTADLLKVLRAQPDKSLMLQQLPELYLHCLGLFCIFFDRSFLIKIQVASSMPSNTARADWKISSVASLAIAFHSGPKRVA
jgi:hypothetical protein